MTALEQQLRDACRDSCAAVGDPPCFELDQRAGNPFNPCDDCLVACGEEPVPQPLDPNAVIAPLL